MNCLLKIAYRGTAFSGYQRQPGLTTVQGVLEEQLREIFQEEVETSASGRTDRGVHATGQVVYFKSTALRPLKGIVEALNGKLSGTVVVLQAAHLPDNDPFHPRFSAVSRTYHYRLLSGCSLEQALHWSSNYWCVGYSLESAVLQRACDAFLGTHDFSTFAARSSVPTHIRTISSFKVTSENAPLPGISAWTLEVTAGSFLRKMVRLMVGAVMEVGVGHLSVSDLISKLDARDPSRSPHPAPPEGLYFAFPTYKKDPFTLGEGALEVYTARPHCGVRLKPR